jgi:hypothetical protein
MCKELRKSKKPRVTTHISIERRIEGRSVYKATKVYTNGSTKGRGYERGDRAWIANDPVLRLIFSNKQIECK